MKNSNTLRLSILISLPVALLCFLFTQNQPNTNKVEAQLNTLAKNKTTASKNVKAIDTKQKGAHIFGLVDSTNYHFLNKNNIEWVTLVAWSVQENCSSSLVKHNNGDSVIIQEIKTNWLNRIALLHAKGFKVFLKPHVWINAPADGKWRSDIFPTNDKNWLVWKKNYREFILFYAHVAQQANVEMFCIGTEFSKLSTEKPDFWKALIKEVRSIYDGKITYAANWYKEYEKIIFWDQLDYIGIQAYFPLVKNKKPSVQQISQGWAKYLSSIEAIQKKYNRKIIFTEMGYKSTSDSAISPWEWVDDLATKKAKSYSAATQTNCYKAFFNTVWPKNWFAGVHIWQMRSDYTEKDSTYYKLDFTPQGKPAELIITKGFE